jgi:hypothetical protein
MRITPKAQMRNCLLQHFVKDQDHRYPLLPQKYCTTLMLVTGSGLLQGSKPAQRTEDLLVHRLQSHENRKFIAICELHTAAIYM